MLFSSIPFLYYFLPLVLVCYFCVPFRWKNFILLFFSLIFYSWGEPRYIFLMVLSILLGYIEGILIERKKHSRLILAGACCIHLGLLMYFKYVDFLIGNLNAIGLSIPLFHIALPIGISFYTFQILSYLIDVYRKDCTAQTNLISFGAYVSMFPQLIAGPIVRYKDIAAQLEVRKHSVEKAALGIRKFIFGLSKKYFLRTLSVRFAVPFKPPQTALFSIIGCMPFPLRCRFILIFPVIVIWRSVSAIFSGSIFRIIFITRICQEVSRNSGDVGTLHWGHGSVTMSISRWAATA